MRFLRLWVFGWALASCPIAAQAVTIDFSTDDFGTALVNGQAINTDVMAGDSSEEFGNYVEVRSTVIGAGSGHLGPAIFDSTPCPGGPNCGGPDPDLLVDLGNVLILQANNSPGFVNGANGKVFTTPNDEADFADRGSIDFTFTSPAELISIDLIDINGGNNVILTLEDSSGDKRVFDVPAMWTNDLTQSPNGWDTLFFDVLGPQAGEGSGGDAIVTQNDAGFDIADVEFLVVAFVGSPTSGGLDNLTFNVPEPSTSALILLGLMATSAAGSRRRAGR